MTSYLNNEHSVFEDLYLLGLTGKEKVTHKEIKKAHISVIREYHPDKVLGTHAKEKNAKKTVEINPAFDRLVEKCYIGMILNTKTGYASKDPNATKNT